MINEIIYAASSWISDVGFLGIFLAAFVETVFPPIPSEVIFPLAGFIAQSNGLGLEGAIGMGAAGAVGSTLGAILIYFIALKIGRPAILRVGKYMLFDETDLQKAESWFKKHGVLAVFVCRMAPGLREIISIPAGLGRMNVPKFIIFTFLGSLIWSICLTVAGFYLGAAQNKFAQQTSGIFDIVMIVIVVIVAAVIGYKYYKRYRSKREIKNG
jgi:membrane protein DedA with SNARE-associated domain